MASRHQFVIGRDVVCRAVAQHRADGHAYRVAAEMDLGGEAAAQRPSAWNWAFFSAAQRCARLVVRSIICNASGSPLRHPMRRR
jgi:hypothetical protein